MWRSSRTPHWPHHPKKSGAKTHKLKLKVKSRVLRRKNNVLWKLKSNELYIERNVPKTQLVLRSGRSEYTIRVYRLYRGIRAHDLSLKTFGENIRSALWYLKENASGSRLSKGQDFAVERRHPSSKSSRSQVIIITGYLFKWHRKRGKHCQSLKI